MRVHPQEITRTRIVVKDRKKEHAMEEEILSRGKWAMSLSWRSESSSSRQTVGLGALDVP